MPQVFTLPVNNAAPESLEELLDLQTHTSEDSLEKDSADMKQLNKVLASVTKSDYNRDEVSTVEAFVKRLESNIEHEELKEKHAYELIETEKSVWIERHRLQIEQLQKALEEERDLFGKREKTREFLLKMIADIRLFLKALKQRDKEMREKEKELDDDKKEETDKGKKKVGDEDHPARSCKHILDSGSYDTDGTYWLDTDGGDPSNKFQAFCDMSNDEGGWTLLITLATDGIAAGYVDASEVRTIGGIDTSGAVWPDTFDTSGAVYPKSTGMFKGSLKPFKEIREEIASGKYTVYGSNMTDLNMDFMRKLYAYESKLEAGDDIAMRPDCRTDYSDNRGKTLLKSCAPAGTVTAANNNLWVGWAVNPGVGQCYFAAGEGAADAGFKGSARCPGKPASSHWGKVWFR